MGKNGVSFGFSAAGCGLLLLGAKALRDGAGWYALFAFVLCVIAFCIAWRVGEVAIRESGWKPK